MKIVTKETGMHHHLVYLKDDNGNSLECYEFTNDENGKTAKEVELMVKYGLSGVEYVSFMDFVKEIHTNDGEIAYTQYPLILVFYLDRELMSNREIIVPFTQSINDMIASKKSNIMAFFLPTDGEERIECINPVQIKDADMNKITAMVKEISTQFNVGDEEASV